MTGEGDSKCKVTKDVINIYLQEEYEGMKKSKGKETEIWKVWNGCVMDECHVIAIETINQKDQEWKLAMKGFAAL